MTNQKDTLEKLEEMQKRVGLMIKQYNDLARSEELESRLVYGCVGEYSGDDKSEPKEIYEFEGEDSQDPNSWSNSQSCWQDSGCSF